MAIQFHCKCERYFQVDDSSAGQTIRCPSCDAMLTVPAVSPAAALATDAYSDRQPARATSGNNWGSPQNRHDDDYDQAGDRRPREIDRRFIRDEPKPAPAAGGFGTINAGIGGGIAMMGIGVVVFVLLLALGYISAWPVIIFVIGLISFFKGIAKVTS
jgi:hypothetical protein